MNGDRDKAIQAGASDYVTKPVDPEKLLSVMHIWLQKTPMDARHLEVDGKWNWFQARPRS